MYKADKNFSLPKNKGALVWKFLDFAKFISLLETNSLYFARADQFNDPYEGLQARLNGSAGNTKNIYINCWHQNECESAAMWDLYIKSNEGIAIQSSVAKLCGSFNDCDHEVYIGRTKYIESLTEKLPNTNPLGSYLYKRKSFAHELEIRAIINLKNKNKPQAMGIFIPINSNLLIEKIYVAPTAEKWIFELVKRLVEKYQLDKEVIKSSLLDDPII